MSDRRVTRRAFVRTGAAGAVAALVPGCVDRRESSPGSGTDTAGPGSAPENTRATASWRPAPAPELEEATIARLQKMMESGEHTSVSLVEAYVARIEALDAAEGAGAGPALRHVLEVNPDLIRLAEEMDRERTEQGARGPLHGVPILLKDNIDTGDRLLTSAGSLAFAGIPAAGDAAVVRKLRDAGAVILGKANLSEWANFRSTDSSSGWSARGGQGRNPYALDRSPCGSSSGPGGATAACLAAATVGTETDGSIVCPSSANSVVGIKPTVGLLSRAGIIPIAHSQDTAGPMARTVADAAILLGAMAGADSDDPATAAASGHVHADYTRYLDPGGLDGARIGIPRERFFGYSAEADRIAEEAIEAMRAAGAVIVDPADIPHAGEYGDGEFTVLLYEFKADLDAYLAARAGTPVRSLADVIRFNEQHADREMPFFGQDIFEMAAEKGPLTESEYREALAECRRLSRGEGIDAVMQEHRLAALVAPTTSPPWTIDLVNGDHGLGGFSGPAAVAGYPHITVPAGYAFGIPVGISFVGPAWSEPTLLRLAYAFEQATGARHPPGFRRWRPQSDEPPA